MDIKVNIEDKIIPIEIKETDLVIEVKEPKLIKVKVPKTIEEKIEEKIPEVKDGKTPTKTEIKAIVKPLIPTAKEIADIVLPKIPKPKDGEDGKSFRFGDLTPYEQQLLTGPQGNTGQGVPRGGTTGQKLIKSSGRDFDTEWTNDSSGGIQSIVAGTNITVDDTDPENPIVSSLSDRYKTTSTTSHTIVSNGSLTFTVETGLAYISQQDVIIAHNSSNHMHGTITSYNTITGVMIVAIQHKTGSGTYSSWDINLDGIDPGIPTLQQVTDEGATTTNESTFSGGILTPQIKADTSAGIDFKSNSGTDIGRMGAGGGSNVSWYGEHIFSTKTEGSVPYFGANGLLSQNNQSFNFNNTDKRLSVFTNLGSEVVTNGNFTGNASGWTVPSGMAYSSNSVSKTSNGTGSLTQNISVYTRREYLLTYTITNWTVGTVTPSMGTSSGTAVGANGTYTERFIASGNSISIVFTPTNTARFTIDSVSIKPLTGNSQKSNINTGGLSIEGSWSNGTPGTTRSQAFNNDGSYTWTDYLFSGVLRSAVGVNSSGGSDTYTSGGNGAAYYNGNAGLTSNTLYSFNVPGYFFHYGNLQAVGYGMFGSSVGAGTGSGTTPTSTLQSGGSVGLKVKRLTASGNIDSTASHWLLDATTAAACSGTPSVTTCSTYTASGQATCESHLPCVWNAGSSCSAFNNEFDMGSCNGTSGCSADTGACSGGDESSCLAYDDAYGGSCAWTLGSNTCPSFSDYATCDANSPCYSDNSGDCNTLSDGGGDGTACATQPQCSYDSGSGVCSGFYFTSCAGDNSTYSCTGTYYTGNCSGTYGAACSGTATCSGYGSSGACTGEAGCTWSSVLNAQLPDGETCPDRTYWLKNDASGGADAIILPYAGQTIEKTSSLTLASYQDGVHITYFKQTYDCSNYASAGACTPTGCTANYAYCSWDGANSLCYGNAVCVGIGDQSTCEGQSYFSGCSGTEIISKNWYIFSRT